MNHNQEREEQEARLKENLSRIKKVIMVLSGKGGVGKTTVAVNTACALAEQGYKTGLLDVDLHGPNVAKMLGIEDKKLSQTAYGIEPYPYTDNLKALSLALMLESPDSPVIWRGPLKMGAIRQFLADVYWGDLDYLVIDFPPGTGDEALSTAQLIPEISGAVLVSTPQDVAILDTRKTVSFARQLKVPVIGLIENMSSYICPHCQKESFLFGKDGTNRAASELNIPFLGRIPLEADMVESGDQGKPYILHKKDSEGAKRMLEIVKLIAEEP